MAAPGYPSVVTTTEAVCSASLTPLSGGNACIDVLGVGPSGLANTSSVTAFPAPPSLVAGFDMSCQQSDLRLSLPHAGLVGGNTLAASNAIPLAIVLAASGGYGEVAVDWSSVAPAARPRVRFSNLSTTAGPITLTNFLVGAKGLIATSSDGAISLKSVDAQCDATDIGGLVGGLRVSSSVGSVVANGLSSVDCDVRLSSQQAAVSLIGGAISNTLGGGMAFLSNR